MDEQVLGSLVQISSYTTRDETHSPTWIYHKHPSGPQATMKSSTLEEPPQGSKVVSSSSFLSSDTFPAPASSPLASSSSSLSPSSLPQAVLATHDPPESRLPPPSSQLTTGSSVSVIKRPHRRQNLQQTCQLCRVHFNSNQQKLDHLRGKKHRLVLERLERRKRARHHDDGLRSTHQNPSVPLSAASSCSSSPAAATAAAFEKNSHQPKAMEHDHTVGEAADSTVCSLTEAVPAPSPSFPLFHPTASASLQTDSSPLRKTWRKEKAHLWAAA